MKKLIKIRGWANLLEASKYASEILGEEVTIEDLYRFSFNGDLKLSINFFNHADALPGSIKSGDSNIFVVLNETGILSEEILYKFFKKEFVSLIGIYDLPIFKKNEQFVIGCGFVYRDDQVFRLLPPYSYQNGMISRFSSLPFTEVSTDIEKIISYQEGRFPIEFPEDYQVVVKSQELEEFGKRMKKETTKKISSENTKSMTTLKKMIITMAIKGYGYDPDAKKSEIPRQICEDAELLGLSIDPDTVRKWLKESKEELSQDNSQ